MTGILEKLQKIPLSGPIRYVFGSFFLLMSLCSFILHGYIAGLLFTLAAIITIPPSASLVEKKINTSIPGIAQFFIVFFLVAIALSAIPVTPIANNNTTNYTETIAAPPSSTNSSEKLVVAAAPEQAVTPAPQQAVTPAPQQAVTPAPQQAVTPIANLKGRLDILTSPDGATVTIDGVSKGATPIEGLSIDAGTHSITVYLSGYDPQHEKIDVANSETKKLSYTLIPETKQNSVSTSTQKETPTTEVASTQTIESSNYQDSQWLSVCSSDMRIVANDLDNAGNAATNLDFTSLSIY